MSYADLQLTPDLSVSVSFYISPEEPGYSGDFCIEHVHLAKGTLSDYARWAQDNSLQEAILNDIERLRNDV